MEWKDTGKTDGENHEENDLYYEDDGYTSFKENSLKKKSLLSGIPLRFIFGGLGIAVVLFLILELGSIFNSQADQARVDALEKKIQQLEERLQKVDGVDEKVTRIWEQAKSFETFKTRFDRSEASMSLRMDHLAMSLDELQKKANQTMQRLGELEKPTIDKPTRNEPAPAKKPAVTKKPAITKKSVTTKTHTVVKGDTLYRISRKYNLSVDELKSINKLSEGTVIHVGQVLVVNGVGN